METRYCALCECEAISNTKRSGRLLCSTCTEAYGLGYAAGRLNKKTLQVAITRATNKIKEIEARSVDEKFRKDSAWLACVNGIIGRVGLAVLDELDAVQKGR
ncbi:MAG: hypothetical protein KKD77_21215 [Gammaproteobacteria bacterium]|nr:hypothetical protein [Gammaproteobacteria bacterium]